MYRRRLPHLVPYMNFGTAKEGWRILQHANKNTLDASRALVLTAIVARRSQVRCDQAGTLLDRIERLYIKKHAKSGLDVGAKRGSERRETHPCVVRAGAIRGADLCTCWAYKE